MAVAVDEGLDSRKVGTIRLTTTTNFEPIVPKITPDHKPEFEAHSPYPPNEPTKVVEKEGAMNPFTYTKPDMGTYCPGPVFEETLESTDCSKK